jgi:hypothetical protein
VERAHRAREPEPPQPTLALLLLAVGPGYPKPPLSAASFHLAHWLTRHLVADAAVDWVARLARSGRRPHPRLRDLIRRTLNDPNFKLPAPKRRFWRLVSSEAPWMDGGLGAHYIWNLPDLLREPGSEDLFQVELAAVMRPYIRLSPSTWQISWASLMEVDDPDEAAELEDRFSRLADAEIDLVGGNGLRFALDVFDKLCDADDRLAAMADELTSMLKLALDLWALVQKAGPDDDPSLYHQPSILPHAQNRRFHHWTALIDLLWRAWSRIDENDCDTSRRIVGRWRSLRYPTFRRMVLAAISQSPYWTAEEKLAVLLNGL